MQYIGHKDDKFKTQIRYDNSTPKRARETKAEMMKEVRESGSDGAYYRALDNEEISGIQQFDVNDDTPSAQKEIKKAEGYKPSKNTIFLKELVAPLSERLDRKGERKPVHGQPFIF